MTGFILSRDFRAPLQQDLWFSSGRPSEEAWQFLSNVDDNNAIIQQGFFNFKQSFADLAAINAAIPSPDDWLSVMTDQGLAVYNPSLGWVLASDNATVVT